MNKNIKLAVAGAVLAAASVANAGIIVPAGEWTLDVSGNVNSYAIWAKGKGSATVVGGLAGGESTTEAAQSTGLLPNFLSVAGSTRQNDLDVTFLISLNPGGYSSNGASGGSGTEHRQAFMTFGDKSWGSIKVGKDLGIYASDAILNDMTLLGVGSPNLTGTTTLGRIGTGFQYADWKQQIAYTTPNFNGFQATGGITQAWNTYDSSSTATGAYTSAAGTRSLNSSGTGGASPAYEGKASYSFAANDVTGKVWVSGFAQKVNGVREGETAYSADIGANLKVAGLDLTGYYYGGEGTGATIMLRDGYSTTGYARQVDGGYVQAKYTLPTKTVAGISWGRSNLDRATGETAVAGSTGNLLKRNEMTTVGLYHPLTKSVNLVAEYSHVTSENQAGGENKNNAGSLGAILFF
jgi:predicted porin